MNNQETKKIERLVEFSKSAVKRIKRMGKNELVGALLEMHNYAEKQKAANIVLMQTIEELRQNIAKQKETESQQTTTTGQEPGE